MENTPFILFYNRTQTMDNIKHQEVLNLIQELQQLGTLKRIATYGMFNTLYLAISRWIHEDVVVYFENYLEKLDNAILVFNKTEYKIFINRAMLGEIYNLSRWNAEVSPSSREKDKFFNQLFALLNEANLEIIKAGVDEIYDNDPNLLGRGSTLKSLVKLNYNSDLYYIIKDLIISYSSLVMNDELNKLQLVRDSTTFMRDTLTTLDSQVVSYIRSKYAADVYTRTV